MMGSEFLEVLAEHGPARLVRDDSADIARRFEVHHTDPDGLACRAIYPQQRFFDAISDYYACVLDAVDESVRETLETGFKWLLAMSDRDPTAMEPLMTDGFVFVDDRSLGWPELTKQGFLDATAAARGTEGLHLVRMFHVVSARGAVSTTGAWTENFGQWQEYELGVAVNTVADGRIDRTEFIPVERLGDALRAFRVLTGEQPR